MSSADQPALSFEHVRDHERAEIAAIDEWYGVLSPELAASGMRTETIGTARARIAPQIETILFNRVQGLGVESAATEDDVDAIVEGYRAAGVTRFAIQLPPLARPSELAGWLQARGFEVLSRWAKLERNADPAPAIRTSARIERIGPEHGAALARVISKGFGLPESIGDWTARTSGLSGWCTYLAFDGDEPVGAASMTVRGAWASFGFATTIESARGRGVQSALIARRIEDARAAGARWLGVETAEPTPANSAPSFRNLTRLGFQPAYYRPNWFLRLA